MPQMTGGQALARSLHREGIRTIFGLPGVQLYHALGGLLETPDIRFVNARHEQGTTYMADGFARVGPHSGVAMVVPGPGMLNASAGLSDAYAASSPVMLISGQIGIDKIGKDTGVLHEINDQLAVARTITKWCSRILDPAQIPAAVHEAFRNMNTGRPRPVEIEIPPETLAQTAEIESVGARHLHARRRRIRPAWTRPPPCWPRRKGRSSGPVEASSGREHRQRWPGWRNCCRRRL